MQLSQINTAANIVRLTQQIIALVNAMSITDPVKKAKVIATATKLQNDFMDAATIEADPVVTP